MQDTVFIRVVVRPVTTGSRGCESPLKFFSLPLEKCVGHRLKLFDIVQTFWSPPRKLLAPPGVRSWLRAWL